MDRGTITDEEAIASVCKRVPQRLHDVVDKFVFDVSHQSYPHKILTGRKNGYISDEHFSEDSGYTNPEESEHDFFNVGHTSTSVSLATGLAKARDIKGDKMCNRQILFCGISKRTEVFEKGCHDT